MKRFVPLFFLIFAVISIIFCGCQQPAPTVTQTITERHTSTQQPVVSTVTTTLQPSTVTKTISETITKTSISTTTSTSTTPTATPTTSSTSVPQVSFKVAIITTGALVASTIEERRVWLERRITVSDSIVEVLKTADLPLTRLDDYDAIFIYPDDYGAGGIDYSTQKDPFLALPVNAIRDYLYDGGIVYIHYSSTSQEFHNETLPYPIYLSRVLKDKTLFEFIDVRGTAYIANPSHPVFDGIQGQSLPAIKPITGSNYDSSLLYILDEADEHWNTIISINIESPVAAQGNHPGLTEANYGLGTVVLNQCWWDSTALGQKIEENLFDYVLSLAGIQLY